MLTVMNMSTGKVLDGFGDQERDEFEIEFGQFKDEVLNAGWMPPSPDLQLGLQEVHAQSASGSTVDAEAFLNSVYRNQR